MIEFITAGFLCQEGEQWSRLEGRKRPEWALWASRSAIPITTHRPPPGKSSPCDLDISFACDEDPLPRTVRTRTNWSVPGIRARRVRQEAVGNQTNWNQGVTYTYTRATGLAPRSPR